jgi:hypothetical protein
MAVCALTRLSDRHRRQGARRLDPHVLGYPRARVDRLEHDRRPQPHPRELVRLGRHVTRVPHV